MGGQSEIEIGGLERENEKVKHSSVLKCDRIAKHCFQLNAAFSLSLWPFDFLLKRQTNLFQSNLRYNKPMAPFKETNNNKNVPDIFKMFYCSGQIPICKARLNKNRIHLISYACRCNSMQAIRTKTKKTYNNNNVRTELK